MADLTPGARFALTAQAGPVVRPRGTRTGVIVADAVRWWRVRYDGCPQVRDLCKSYARPEWEAAMDAA